MNFRHYTFVVILCLVSVQCAWAQLNMFAYASPHYWMQQASSEIYAGKYDIAYEHLQKALTLYKGQGDMAFQMSALEAMGALKAGLGEWDKADSHYKEALQMATDNKDDAAQSILMADLLALYRTAGDITGYNHYQKALDSLYQVSHSDKMKTMYHVYWSKEYLGRKEFVMAENQLKQCWDALHNLHFFEKEQAKLQYYSIMLNLKQQQRQYQEAIRYAKNYIEQTKNINGNNSDQQYQAYGNLCTLYALDNDSTEAFACLDSIECGIGHVYQDKEMTAVFYNTKGECYAHFKKYEKAIEYFDRAYKALDGKTTEESPAKIRSVFSKSMAYLMLKQYDDAFDTYCEYVEASKKKYGEESRPYFQTLLTAAIIEAACGETDEASDMFCSSMNYLIEDIKQLWLYSTPTQRELFWIEPLNTLNRMVAIAIDGGIEKSELTETCYNALLFTKALLLETEKSVADIICNEGTEADMANYRELLGINNRLLELKKNYEYNKHEIDSLILCQRQLELQLGSTCQNYKEYSAYLDINFQKVKNHLAGNEMVIDFSDYQTEDSVHQYAAYIFDKDTYNPILKKCFEQQQLDSLLDGMQNYTLYDYTLLQDKATDVIWRPIAAYIPEGSTVYYVPSGIMHSIALEALPLSDGTTLGQHYHFVRLTSAREILRRRRDVKDDNKTAALYGGLKYSLSAETMTEESKCYETSDLAWMMRSSYGKKGFKDLGKTKEEVEQIERTLTNNGYEVKTYMEAKGNAESFIALSGKATSIIHIATHGFYYTPDEAKGNNYLDGYTDAMALSGLVFAGGNTAWLGKRKADGVLGGVLTAKDIANLDFKGTDLIVLSACQTAQGKVTAEGVFGLQRAFKKAGVGTIVMSLWKVDDKVTSEFMATFYERLTDRGNAWDKRKAFEEAREIIRGKHPDPFHWAAFVMLD